jgi:hypothetical protein
VTWRFCILLAICNIAHIPLVLWSPNSDLCPPSFTVNYGHQFTHESWAPVSFGNVSTKAERQKVRSEQQAAVQSSSKRSRIDFAKEAASGRSTQEKNTGRKSRFEPYGNAGGHPYGDGKGKDYSKDRQKSRWG